MKKLKLLLSNSFFLILIYFIGDYMYKFIAHRGNDDDLAENSKEAILNSLSKPYIDGVEFDIRITKDNKFVINHNATINLNSNKIGTIKNMTLKQLKEVKFKNHNKVYRIATLNEVLKQIKNDKIIIIEIKEEKNYNTYQKKKLLKLLKKYSYLNIYLTSFNYDLINDLKKDYLNCGLLVGKVLNRNKDISVFPFLLITLDFYEKYEGIQQLFIWTIDSPKKLKEISDDCYIITDKAFLLFNSHYNHH